MLDKGYAKRILEEALKLLAGLGPDSKEYREFAADVLNGLDPYKPYGTNLYNAIARLSWNMFFEGVALRVNPSTTKIEIYLRKRAADEVYPLEWHAPGSAFRPGETERDVANRLEREFGTPIISFRYIGEYVDWKKGEIRGSGVSRIYLVHCDGSPREDERHDWYPVDQLPENTVEPHRTGIIPKAIKAYAHRV
ncbi:MAG: hypothetical protein WC526_01655 [Patescibacteria group bacterium]